MNIKTIFILFCFFALLSCEPGSERQAKDLLQKSIQTHEQGSSWEELVSIKFRKWTQLLNEDGSVESEVDQLHEYRLKPYFEGKITWTVDSVNHVSIWDGAQMTYFMGGNEVKNTGFLAQKKKDLDAAFYAFAQPWKLLDDGSSKVYEGQKMLENGLLVEVIKVDYGPDSDQWWFYFDPENHQMIGNEVQLKDHRSRILNQDYDTKSGLVLHGARESYRIGESGQRLYLRAKYRYDNYELTFK